MAVLRCATRTFSGTPASTDTGTVSVKVLATDSSNGAISDTFDILVVPALTLSFEDSDTSNWRKAIRWTCRCC